MGKREGNMRQLCEREKEGKSGNWFTIKTGYILWKLFGVVWFFIEAYFSFLFVSFFFLFV